MLIKSSIYKYYIILNFNFCREFYESEKYTQFLKNVVLNIKFRWIIKLTLGIDSYNL